VNAYYNELLPILDCPDFTNFKSEIPDFMEFVEYLLENGYIGDTESSDAQVCTTCDIQSAYLPICDGSNLRRKTCYYDPTATYKCMDLDVARKAIELLAVAGVKSVTVSGGEPLLHPDIIAILQMIKTNGILLNEEVVEQLLDVVDILYVSIDGL